MYTLYLVMPTYNEIENIKQVVESWYPIIENKKEGSRLVIADFGSTDGTHELLLELKKEYPKLEILDTKRKEHGPKLIALYKYAIECGADYIFQTDSDNQTNPDEFHEFWNLKNKYDVIIGNRTKRGDGYFRFLVEKIVCLLLKIIFNVNSPDANTPFRLMKSSILKKYIDKLPEDFNIPNIMYTTYFLHNKERVLFSEITFKPRKAGKNSINFSKIINIGYKAIIDFYKLRKEM